MRFWIIGLAIFFTSSVNAQIKVAVIGGGMTGVSAAHYISELGFEDVQVTLFEKEAKLGGNAQTIPIIENNGDTIHIDIGPQYFAEGPWDDYIQLLKSYDLYNQEEISAFKASFTLYKAGEEKQIFISPKGGLRGGKLKDALQFFRFYKASRKIYEGKDTDYPLSVGQWVNELNCDEGFKKEVILPFLAATLGTSVNQIIRISTKEIVKLYAFRPPLRKGKFMVSTQGMGNLVQTIGAQLETKGVRIEPNHYIHNFRTFEERYAISMNHMKEEQFDFIIFAVHPDHIVDILETHNPIPRLKTNLEMFSYFNADIALHTDSTFVDHRKSSFMNIETNSDNKLVQSTMHLKMIDEKYSGLYKSWVDSTQLKTLEKSGKLINHVRFFHPLISPAFVSLTDQMYQIANRQPSMYIAGGWTLGLETQNTAVQSGKKAAQKFKYYYERRKVLQN